MLKESAKIAYKAGMKKENVFVPDNGSIMKVSSNGIEVLKEKAPTNYVFVDGLGVGDVGEIVLRDRQMLAKDGMFVIVAVVDRQTGKVKGSPDIISRGFIYLRESKDLLSQTRRKVIEIINKAIGSGGAVNWTYVKDEVKEKVGQFLFSKTQRRPIVLPVIIEV
jgi:ribonuclease J